MRVGDYVRTKYGDIFKYIKTDEDGKLRRTLKSDNGNVSTAFKTKDVIKSSPNIIDLIEVGDYVNDLKITLVNEPSMANCNKRLLYAEDDKGYLIKMFNEEDIKSIVTHQQFSAMEYKVESEVK